MNLQTLRRTIPREPYLAALPSALPNGCLRAIASDLRREELASVEECRGSDADVAGPIMVLSQLILGRLRDRNIESFRLTPQRLLEMLRTYQWFVEREMVARSLKIRVARDDDDLLRVIDEYLDASSGTEPAKSDHLN